MMEIQKYLIMQPGDLQQTSHLPQDGLMLQTLMFLMLAMELVKLIQWSLVGKMNMNFQHQRQYLMNTLFMDGF